VRVLRAVQFFMILGARLDKGRLLVGAVVEYVGYLAAPFAALALAHFVDDAIAHRGTGALVLALVAAVLLVVQVQCHHFAFHHYVDLVEMQQSALRVELIGLVNAPDRVEHLDDPSFADTADLVRKGVWNSTQVLESIFALSGLLLQTAVTAAILIDLNPWLAFLPILAVPPVLLGNRAQAVLENARERTAEKARLNRHLVEIATSATSVKELRLFGTEAEVLKRQDAAWRELTDQMWRAQAKSGALRGLGQLVFALGYGGAILLVVHQASQGRATVGGILLVITLAVQVSAQIAGALGQLSTLQTAGRTVERIQILRKMVGAPGRANGRRRPSLSPVPERLTKGITLEAVSFHYPGTSDLALDNITLEIPAGRTVALVGENGAGKSTVVKLLCGLYAPTSGRILVDGVDLSGLDPPEWRKRVATLFQDFFRVELTLRESIGLGELELIEDDIAITDAVRDARATDVVRAVPSGLAGFVGRAYTNGTDLSGGQWQTVGLARSVIRRHPLLQILDEPAAALDAAAEHALFERFGSSAEVAARERGGATVLISHRFSTVLMADTIAVLAGGQLRECGSHRQLMANDSLYAELFRLQSRAYRY
jgi:ATP-binding cassette subfamily B protein